MPRNLLVGLDESPYSEAAVELGIDWAKRFDCLLVGMGVIDEPTIRGSESPERMAASYQGAYRQMVADASHRVDRILERFTLRCTEAGVSHKLLEDIGSPCEQIMIESQRYDLLLMGQKSFFHFETSGRACDTLDKLLHATPRPVVAVPRQPAGGSGVLIAYDGSVQAARALAAFAASGLSELGAVHVLCSHRSSKVDASKTIDRAIEYLRFHDVAAVGHPLVDDRCASEDILEEAHRLGCGLIVMGAYGRSAMAEFFLGSVTRAVLEKTDVPLFLFH